jgi:hypothetical protein
VSGYTKLFQSIVTSTVWQEPNDCRVLWITMLALKERNHVCPATVPALAKISNISIEQCESYLKKFQEPDPYSRSQDFEGRRIKKVDGGWLILNGEKYRDLIRRDDRREYVAQKVREHRARKRVNKRKQCNPGNPQAEAEAEAEAESRSSLGTEKNSKNAPVADRRSRVAGSVPVESGKGYCRPPPGAAGSLHPTDAGPSAMQDEESGTHEDTGIRCERCGRIFKPGRRWTRFCSQTCQRGARNDRKRAARASRKAEKAAEPPFEDFLVDPVEER